MWGKTIRIILSPIGPTSLAVWVMILRKEDCSSSKWRVSKEETWVNSEETVVVTTVSIEWDTPFMPKKGVFSCQWSLGHDNYWNAFGASDGKVLWLHPKKAVDRHTYLLSSVEGSINIKAKTSSNNPRFLQISLYHICFVIESVTEPIITVLGYMRLCDVK